MMEKTQLIDSLQPPEHFTKPPSPSYSSSVEAQWLEAVNSLVSVSPPLIIHLNSLNNRVARHVLVA